MRIDVHAHYFPETYLDLLQHFGSQATDIARHRSAGGSSDELEARLALMDSAQVQMQVLSASPQLPYFEDGTHAIEAARAINDLYADLVRRYPTRFAAFAAAPLSHIDAALAEIERALDQLHMVMVTVATSVLGRSLADPQFEPLYRELDRRGTALYIHPSRGRQRLFAIDRRLRSDLANRRPHRGHHLCHATHLQGHPGALPTHQDHQLAPGRSAADAPAAAG
jgi:6-methylsalicylate decarboxylase